MMPMRSVEIAWINMSDPTKLPAAVGFAWQTVNDDLEICEDIYEATNTYSGHLWSLIQNILPANRTHTALSVGDRIRIDNKIYRCAPMGFKLVEEVAA